MMDMEKLGAELLSGRQGGAIRDMANSPEAKKLGAMALFGEKYGDIRRGGAGGAQRRRRAAQGAPHADPLDERG